MKGLLELPQRARRDEPIRFFFDESALGIGKVMATARSDCIFPGRPRSPIRAGTDDVDWIPVASSQEWIVVAA